MKRYSPIILRHDAYPDGEGFYPGMQADPEGKWVHINDVQGDSDDDDPTPDPAE